RLCILVGPLFLFFFSSRRRHTRSKRDWSSDVCSSDLIHYAAHPKISRAWQSRKGTGWLWYVAALAAGGLLLYLKWRASGLEAQRSEERRVGKERRYRWGRGEERRTKNRRAMRDSEART